jgi:hypothetical protein
LKFIKKALEHSEVILTLCPASFLISEKETQSKIYREVRNKLQGRLQYVKYFNGNSILGIQSFVPISFSIINHSKTIEIDDFGEKCTTNDINKCKYRLNDEIYLQLKDKILMYCQEHGSLLKILSHNNYRNSINMSDVRGHVNIALTRGHHLNNIKMYQDDYYTILTRSCQPEPIITKKMYFSFESEEEANNMVYFLKTFFCRFCLSIQKIGCQNNRKELSSIPLMNMKIEWTDEKLFKHFNLIKEEIEYIYKHIPKYY